MSESYESIRQSILDRIPQDDDIREGSPLAITIDPVAYVLANHTEIKMEETVKNSHPLTADREQLLIECEIFGLYPYPASPSRAEGKFNIPIAIGDRFSISGLTFAVISESPTKEEGYYFYYLECESAGEIGNIAPGKLIPIDLHPGLTYAQLTRITINGEEEEDTESLRERFRSLFNAKAYGGNIANYFEWLAEVSGVGRSKIVPCENPEGLVKPGFVTVVITDNKNEKASEELIKSVQDYLCPKDPVDWKNCGVGHAPIGADVYVVSAKEKEINLKFTVETEGESKKNEIEEALKVYFQSVNLEWGSTSVDDNAYYPKERNMVHIRTAQLISAILSVPGVVDVKDLTINENTENIDLEWDTIAKLGVIDETDTVSSI